VSKKICVAPSSTLNEENIFDTNLTGPDDHHGMIGQCKGLAPKVKKHSVQSLFDLQVKSYSWTKNSLMKTAGQKTSLTTFPAADNN
jgi:hypothetical protein